MTVSFICHLKSSKPGSKEMCLHQLEGCISDIRSWMANNMLKLNGGKTELIIFGTCQQLAQISDISIKVGSMKIQPVEEVTNLGYFMDRFLKNSAHINKLSAAMFHNLRNIKRIQNKLDYVGWIIFSKTELKFVERQAFTSFKHGFFQVWGKCLPQSFPTPNGVPGCPCNLIGTYIICFCWLMLLPLLVKQQWQ